MRQTYSPIRTAEPGTVGGCSVVTRRCSRSYGTVRPTVLAMAFSLLMVTACEGQQQRSPDGYALAAKPHSVELTHTLREISGLAADTKGRLFAHDDERGVVYHLDAMTGSVLKRFILGRSMVTEDFEGIAIAGHYMYLVTSAGVLYQFREGKDGQRVEYRVIRTGLNRDNNVEGLCYDSDSNSLLLACKGNPGKGYRDKRAVYAFDLQRQTLEPRPRLLLDERRLKSIAKGKHVQPSGIERHPFTGNYFIVASQGSMLVEMTPKGKMVSAARLDADRHAQPEGITFLPNGDLLISDEGKKHGRLTLYRYGK